MAAVVGVLAQILSQHRRLVWAHVYSHSGDGGNELADSLVYHFSARADARHVADGIVSKWCDKYSAECIKLMYLLFLPKAVAHAYPEVSKDRTAIASSALAEVKFGLPSSNSWGSS